MFIVGTEAATKFMSKAGFDKAAQPKEWFEIPGATHHSLYDNEAQVGEAVVKLEEFFGRSLERRRRPARLSARTVHQGDQFMSKHVSISPAEAADRLAIRELVEAYAHCADRRDAKGQMSLFTADTHFVVFMNAKDPKPSQELHSRESLAPVFADLNKYAATTHFIGQSTIFTLTSNIRSPIAGRCPKPLTL